LPFTGIHGFTPVYEELAKVLRRGGPIGGFEVGDRSRMNNALAFAEKGKLDSITPSRRTLSFNHGMPSRNPRFVVVKIHHGHMHQRQQGERFGLNHLILRH
jgi:hypothetical protein